MASKKTIDQLPDEVLVEIFTYLSIEDLVGKAQHVCVRWKMLVQDARLWRDLTFTPSPTDGTVMVVGLLCQMPRLKSFAFHRYHDVEPIIDALCAQCKDVMHITWNLPGLTDDILKKFLLHLPEIESFHVHPSVINEVSSMNLIAQFPKLIKLKCTWAGEHNPYHHVVPFQDHKWNGCKFLQHIEMVTLNNTSKVTEQLVQGNAKNLLTLNLRGIHKNLLIEISKCQKLQKLHMDFLSKICNDFSTTLPRVGKLKNLKSLCLRLFVDSQKDVLCSLFADGNLPNLVELDLSHCMNFSNRVAQNIARNCMGLQSLKLQACNSVDDGCMEKLAKCRELRFLDVSGCISLTEVGLAHIAQCRQLDTLHLTWVGCVSGHMMNSLAGAVSLRKLFLDHNQLFQPDLVSLATRLPRLTLLSVYHCPEVNVVALQQSLPRCRISSSRPTKLPS